MFTLKQISVFDAVARLGSVSLAAEELHMTQPAASISIQQLEKSLGAELFLRNQKKLVLSEKGSELHLRARSLLIDADELRMSISSRNEPTTLKIAASATVAEYLLGDLIAHFMKKNPEAKIDLNVMPAFDIINRVDDLAIDVGLLEFVSIRTTLEIIRWRTESLVVFCAADHAIAKKSKIKAEDLSEVAWCLQHRFSDTRRQFVLAILAHVGTLNVVLESDSIPVICAAVADGAGFGCLPRPCIQAHLSTGRIKELNVTNLDLPFPMTAISKKGLRKSRLVEEFLRHILSSEPHTFSSS